MNLGRVRRDVFATYINSGMLPPQDFMLIPESLVFCSQF